jgi:DUF4097 and DUF4098 domain-containing protein YvlB
MYEFPVNGPIDTNIRINGGAAQIVAEERDTAMVEITPYGTSEGAREAAANTRVEMQGDTLVVEPPTGGGWLWRRDWRVRMLVRVPLDSGLHVRSASADVHIEGRWAEGGVHTASGRLSVAEVTGALNAHTASGDVQVGRVGGGLQARSASGDLVVGAIGGESSLTTASGDIRIGDAAGSVTVRTASGDVELRQAHSGEVRMNSASGDLVIGVAPGTLVHLDLTTVSGDTRSDLAVENAPPPTDKGAGLGINARTVSGNISVVRAVNHASHK